MLRNVGSADRAVRIALGIGLLAMVVVGPQTPWGWLGLIPLGTALVGWCPLYAMFGISSYRTRKHVT
jgi:hypothetical protein